MTRWLAALAAPAAALRLLPVVMLIGVAVLGIWFPDVRAALTAVPALAAAFSRRPWYPVAVGAASIIVGYVLTAHDDHSLLSPEAFSQAGSTAVVATLGCLGVIIRNSRERAFAQTRMVAEAVQRVLARPIPAQIGDVRAAVHYTAAHAYANMGGDLYEVLQTRFGVRAVIGDVQGKGLGAVETAAAVLGAFREAAHHAPDLTRLARRLADPLDRVPGADGEQFVTAALIELRHDATAKVVNCGHPSPLLLRGSTRPRALKPPSRIPPLGVLSPDQVRPPALSLSLQRGDRILLYTDGVTEARDRDGNFYPLADRLPGRLPDDPSEALRRLNGDILRHVGHRLEDDAAMVLLQYEPAPE